MSVDSKASRAHVSWPRGVVPVVALALALATVVAAWRAWPNAVDPRGSVVAAILLAAVVAAYRFPLHLYSHAKVYVASVPYYLLAVLTMPPLAATVAGLAAAIAEASVRRARGNTTGTVVAEAGRRALVVLLGSLVAHLQLATPDALALAVAAIVLALGDLLTFPLVVSPLSGYSAQRVIVAAARAAYLVEGAQYLTALLGALVALQQVWALALLALPTALVYLAFHAMERAREAQREAELARAKAEQAQRAAEDAVRVRDDFLTAASHDLRTPLTSIMGRTDVMQMYLGRDGTLTEDWLSTQITPLRSAARRMMSTVEEITDAALLQMGQRLMLQIEAVDVGDMVQGVARMVMEANPKRGASPIDVDAPVGLVVDGDRARLERVVQNIIGNAVKYSPAGAPVRVEVRRRDERALISVCDRGVGIPAHELPNIFTHFYRAATSKGIGGTGIGLAGAKMIVEQHGGAIQVASTVGSGTTVLISLPIHAIHGDEPDGEDDPKMSPGETRSHTARGWEPEREDMTSRYGGWGGR